MKYLVLLLKIAFSSLLLLSTLIILAWYNSPKLAPLLVKQQLQNSPWQIQQWQLLPPQSQQWQWPLLRLADTSNSKTLELHNVVLRRLDSELHYRLDIEQLIFSQTQASPVGATGQAVSPPQLLQQYFNYLGFLPRHLNIKKAVICLPKQDCLALELDAKFSPENSQLNLTGSLPLGIQSIRASLSKQQLTVSSSGLFNAPATIEAIISWQEHNFNGQLTAKLSSQNLYNSPAAGLVPEDLVLQSQDIQLNAQLQAPWAWLQTPSQYQLISTAQGQLTVDAQLAHEPTQSQVSTLQPITLVASLQDQQISIASLTNSELEISHTEAELQLSFPAQALCKVQLESLAIHCQNRDLTAQVVTKLPIDPLGHVNLSLNLRRGEFSWQPNQDLKAKLELDLQMQDALNLNLRSTALVQLQQQQVQLNLNNLSILDIDFSPIQLSHNLLDQTGSLNSEQQWNLASVTKRLADFYPLPVELAQGDAALSLAVSWQGTDLAGIKQSALQLELSKLALDFEEYQLRQGNFSMLLAGWPELNSQQPAVMQWQEINAGVQLSNFTSEFSLSVNPLTTELDVSRIQFDFEAFSGRVSSEPFNLDIDQGNGLLTLQLRELDLAEILSLQDQQLFSQGKLNGEVPVNLRQWQLQSDHAQIFALAPGGFIQYLPSVDIQQFASGNPQMALVINALENFQYDKLEADMSYYPDGRLLLQTHIRGNNPNFQQGREIQFNLNLEQNVLTLLKSLRLTEQLNKTLDKRLQ